MAWWWANVKARESAFYRQCGYLQEPNGDLVQESNEIAPKERVDVQEPNGDLAQESNGVAYSCQFIAHAESSGARRMEMEKELKEQDSDSEPGVIAPQIHRYQRPLRTDILYDAVGCYPGYNLRCVKWGPRSGIWEHHWTPIIAQGPPNEYVRYGNRRCWLCDVNLVEHKRTWTRPSWKRQVTSKKVIKYKQKPPSELRMTIFCCPNGCDADDALQVLLDKTDHTGPATRPPHAAPWLTFMGSSTWPLTQYQPRQAI